MTSRILLFIKQCVDDIFFGIGFVKLQRINGGTNHDAGSTKDILVIAASSSTSGTSDTESTSTYTELPATDNPQLVKDEIDDSTPDDCFVYRYLY